VSSGYKDQKNRFQRQIYRGAAGRKSVSDTGFTEFYSFQRQFFLSLQRRPFEKVPGGTLLFPFPTVALMRIFRGFYVSFHAVLLQRCSS
jgi:hypothetical protein